MQRQSQKDRLFHMRPALLIWSRQMWFCCGLAIGAGLVTQMVRAGQALNEQPLAEVTNVSQIRLLATQTPKASFSIHLQGDVWWANAGQGKFVLKDDSGVEELETDLHGESVTSGQKIILEGNGTITLTGAGFKIGTKGPVVDNDGVHVMIEKSGAVFLKAGLNPIRVEWFNGVEKYGLKVEYKGPSLTRQEIPDSALFRVQVDVATGASNWINGLDFQCFEASGESLLDFNQLTALKTGTASNFDLSVMVRQEHVGLCFTGFLKVSQDGLYTFYLTSDDGSKLFVGRPSLQIKAIGRATTPKPQPLLIGQRLSSNGGQWGEVEGKITFASQDQDGLRLELSTETGRVHVEVANSDDLPPSLLLDHRIRATGFCQSTYASDGRNVLGIVLVPDRQEIEEVEPAPAVAENTETNAAGLPELANAAEVHRLKREEAQHGYPVKFRGVITSVQPEHHAFTIQDSTRGIYVFDFSEDLSQLPRVGDFLKLKG